MRICAYVQEAYSKANYKNECLDTRQFLGLRVIIDCLERAGYTVEWAGIATVHLYDIVLVSITSDCDWWTFIEERTRWRPGSYKVLAGGAGVLHVAPFTPFVDWFMLGRGEDLIVPLVRGIERDGGWDSPHVIESASFSPNKIYTIAQGVPYPHPINLNGKEWREGPIGCTHRCLFCGYTWQRRNTYGGAFVYKRMSAPDADFGERALVDYCGDGSSEMDWSRLRTTAIDGFSERLRFSVNKRISHKMLVDFLRAMVQSDAKPHQVKLYNMVGLPGETEEDWFEFLDALKSTEDLDPRGGKQWSIVLHSTPFRAMPATPLACAPMSYVNYRGRIGRVLGPDLKGGLIYQGRCLWSVESMGTDSLATTALSAICHRGSVDDSEAVARIARSRKFWRAPSDVRLLTIERYFDIKTMFGPYTAATLPSRYLRTYAQVERMWPTDERGDTDARTEAAD